METWRVKKEEEAVLRKRMCVKMKLHRKRLLIYDLISIYVNVKTKN